MKYSSFVIPLIYILTSWFVSNDKQVYMYLVLLGLQIIKQERCGLALQATPMSL